MFKISLLVLTLLVTTKLLAEARPWTETRTGLFFISCQPHSGECYGSDSVGACLKENMRAYIEDEAPECKGDFDLSTACFCIKNESHQ